MIAVGALLLFVALFLDWYGAGRGSGGNAASAWTSFELVDLLLALIALGAVIAALEPLVRGTSRVPENVAAVAGPAALVLVLVSIINKPPILQGFDVEPKVGAWLALAGSAIMCAGTLLALNRVSFVVQTRDATPHTPGRQTPPPVERTPVERGDETRAAETETRPLPPRD